MHSPDDTARRLKRTSVHELKLALNELPAGRKFSNSYEFEAERNALLAKQHWTYDEYAAEIGLKEIEASADLQKWFDANG
jgi:hypothetical protein